MDSRPGNSAIAAKRPRGARRAFTLIEILVVIFILGVLAAIVVSVAGYVMNTASRQETAATQKLLMEAIQAFRDAGTPKVYPFDCYCQDPSSLNYDPSAEATPDISGKVLVNFLTGRFDTNDPNAPTDDRSQTPPVKAATELLLKLPEEAWKGGTNEAVRDGWGKDMRYEYAPLASPRRGGLGGRPVVISAGPDSDFGDDDETKEEDNVRSDESQ